MGTCFHGWPEQAYAVLLQLGGDPSRETGERVRRDREVHVRQPPRGYPADHPRAVLLRHRSLIAVRELESEAVDDVEPVHHACQQLRPLLGWLAEHTVTAGEERESA